MKAAVAEPARAKHLISAAGRRAIAAAKRRRWANRRHQQAAFAHRASYSSGTLGSKLRCKLAVELRIATRKGGNLLTLVMYGRARLRYPRMGGPA
jgi:hypothetical protein